MKSSNPDWVRDELIVALDFYLKHKSNLPNKTSEEILLLSKNLQHLGGKLFPVRIRSETFRNPNSVYMKLMNFRRLDPEYTADGRRGLTRGAKSDEEVWAEFSGDSERCHATAEAILSSLYGPELSEIESVAAEVPGIEEAAEGRLLTRKHLTRERNKKLVENKKKQAKARAGKIACEVCGFEFGAHYGSHGEGFIECHHTKPLASLSDGHKTHINDLVLLCANCHRMIHRSKHWLTIEQLKTLLRV